MIEISDTLLIYSSKIIALLSLIALYFGKIIADTKVEKYEKQDLIINGIYFMTLYIFIPILIILFLSKYITINKDLIKFLLFIIQIIIFFVYSKYYSNYTIIEKYNLENEYYSKFRKKIVTIKKVKHLFKDYKNLSEISLNLIKSLCKFLEKREILFILSMIIIFSMLITLESTLSFLTNCIISFINFSLIAYAYGNSNAFYPKSKIILTDGKEISGKLIKFREYVYIINKKYKYFINQKQIKIIKTNKMKD